jgi:hypothetical protein
MEWSSPNDGKISRPFLAHAWRGAPLEMTGRTTKAVHRGPAAYRPRYDGAVGP